VHLHRPLIGAFVLAVALALGACGSDGEERAGTTATSPTRTEGERAATSRGETETEATETETTRPEAGPEPPEPGGRTGPEAGRSPSPSPERQPGGAGDEEPARTLVLFTGEDGRISPRVVRVPAFISIRVELRSADGRPYGLEFESETARVRLRTSGRLGSVSSTIDGLRPGEAITGSPTGARNRVRIEATAEPGP
jgi:hypothetical protein